MDRTNVQLLAFDMQPFVASEKRTSYTLHPADIALLEAVYTLRFITAEQLIRFRGLSLNSLPKLREKLFILAGKSKKRPALPYLQRFYQARESPLGSLPFVYALAKDGKKELGKRGKDIQVYARLREIIKRLPNEIDHHLAINEVLIAALHIHKHEPRVRLFDFQHDFMLKHHPEKFTVSLFKGTSNEQVTPYFSPDGVIDFRINRGEHDKPIPRRVFLEMDMGTHERHEFKKKIAAYIEFFSSGIYAKSFDDVTNVSVLFVTPKGVDRREKMRLWTREQFDKPLYSPHQYLNGLASSKDDYARFLFAAVPEGTLHPKETFLDSICYTCENHAHPEPLLRLPH
jgi:Replication-relaxation